MRDLPTITRDGEHLYLDGEEVDAGKASAWVETLRRETYDAQLRLEWRRKREDEAAEVEAQRARVVARAGMHIVVSGDRIQWRENGQPMVWSYRDGERVASKVAHIGPGPALEFVVRGGRKWRPLAELESYMTVREWREMGDAG